MFFYVKTPSGVIFTVETDSEEKAAEAVAGMLAVEAKDLTVTEEDENEEMGTANQEAPNTTE